MATSPIREGNLAEIGFCEILAELCRARETGVLRLSGGGAEKSVYLQGGSIVFAASKDPDDRLGELLLNREVIRREQFDEATVRVGPGKRLGTVLVEMGILPAEDLPRWVREQVKEILFSLFSWTEGLYRFEAGPFPSDEAITLRLSTAEIFLSGLRQVQKWSVLRKGAGEIRLPYQLAQDHQEALKEVTLGGDEKRLLSLLQSKPTTMEQAALESGLSTLRVYQLFFAFRVLGVVIPHQAPVPVRTPLPKDVPMASASDAPARALPDTPPVSEVRPTESIQAVTPAKVATAKALKDTKPPAAPQPAHLTDELNLVMDEETGTGGAEVGAQTVILKMPVPQPAASRKEPAGSSASGPLESAAKVAPVISDSPAGGKQIKKEPAGSSIGEPLESAAKVAPVISDSPAGGKPVKKEPAGSSVGEPLESTVKVAPVISDSPAGGKQVKKQPAGSSSGEPLVSAAKVAPVIADSPIGGKPAKETASKGPDSTGPKTVSRPAPAIHKEVSPGNESGPVKETSPAVPNPGKRGKADFRVVRVEGERLDGNGAQQIEDLLRQWSGKGYRLAGVVPGKKEGLFGSSASCFFVFEREPQS